MLEQYSKMVDHSDQEDLVSEDDFITLKRQNHGLSDGEDIPLPSEENKSKRKLKMETSKKALTKLTPASNKIIFDDSGKGHEMYELGDAEEFFKAGADVVKEAGTKFAEGERNKLKIVDVADKAEAKEKKREKKRKRKEKDQEVMHIASIL